jgi:TFIIIC subunit triple barrel domain
MAAAARGQALGVLRPSADAAGPSTAAGTHAGTQRLGSLDMPLREPLRWLHAPVGVAPPVATPQSDALEAETDAADGAAAVAPTAAADEYVYVDLPGDARARMETEEFEFRGLDTEAPVLAFADGTRFVGTWEASLGSMLVFEDAAQQQQDKTAPQLVGSTESRLTFRAA